MKNLIKSLFTLALAVISLGVVNAQEYDDMYYSSKDRKKVKKVKADKVVQQELAQVQQFANTEESYSQKNVNPEYLARYQATSFEEDATASEAYFDESYDPNNTQISEVTSSFINNSNIQIRDRYGNVSYFNNYNDVFWSNPALYQGSVFDPMGWNVGFGWNNYGYDPWMAGYGFNRWGYDPWMAGYGWNNWGWNSGIYVGIGFGWNSWGWNRWNRWGYNSWGWNRWNRWGWNNPFWCPPGYGWGNRVVVINNFENRNNRYRGQTGPSRSRVDGIASSRSRSRSNDGIVSRRGRTASSSSVRGRSYDDAQSRYYRRSRSRAGSESGSAYTSRSSRSRSSSNYSPRSRSYDQAPSSTRSRSYSPSGTSGSRSYSTPSNSRSRSYQAPSNSGSRSGSYGTPSRSRSYSPSSGGSRSSGYSGGSSRSRSSSGYSGGGSRGRSSGSYSGGSRGRSSGGSSRSSGGSSRSSSRRGN